MYTFVTQHPVQTFLLGVLLFWGIVNIIKAIKGQPTDFDGDE